MNVKKMKDWVNAIGIVVVLGVILTAGTYLNKVDNAASDIEKLQTVEAIQNTKIYTTDGKLEIIIHSLDRIDKKIDGLYPRLQAQISNTNNLSSLNYDPLQD